MKHFSLQFRLAGAIFPAILLVACSTPLTQAPVVERPLSTTTNTNEQTPSTVKEVTKATENTKGMYVVKAGDTLYRIALDHGVKYSDLLAWNKIPNPNDIKVDQVLRVSPPDSGTTNSVVTIAAPQAEVKSIPTNPSLNKAGPKGDKRPYSENALTELQKSDSTTNSAVASTTSNVKSDAVVASKATEKAKETTDLENIEWVWPAEGKVVGTFDDVKNKGLDIAGKAGQDVFAASSGKVTYAGNAIPRYGNVIVLMHSPTLLSVYAHNKTILVKEGQTVSKGQKIAEMGSTDSETIKLHFEIRRQGKTIDPMKFLPAR